MIPDGPFQPPPLYDSVITYIATPAVVPVSPTAGAMGDGRGYG